MKKILGLDIGTTSIGWAIVEALDKGDKQKDTKTETDINNNRTGIHKDAVGVRIIAQDTERFDRGLTLNDPKGSTLTPTANRRKYRGSRRMKSRYKLRRGKLYNILSFIGIEPNEDYYTNKKGKRGENNDIGKAIYELRNRAISKEITLPELGRIFLHLNQWRGYSSDRFAKDEKPKFDYYVAQIIDIDELNKTSIYDEKNKDEFKYFKITLKIKFDEPYNIGDDSNKNLVTELEGFLFKKEINFKTGDFITIKKPEFKQDKKGKSIITEYYKFTLTTPDPTDWNYKYQTLQKTLTEWCEDGGTVGSYFYNFFYNENTSQIERLNRIRNNVVNRKWYENEFDKIWDYQFEKHKEYFEKIEIEDVVKTAFKDYQAILNEVRNKKGIKEQLRVLIKDKIIFFQRPWQQAKSKGRCIFEKIKVRKDIVIKGTGKKETIEEHIGRTVIPRSHPLFQEFKIWQQINNVRIYLNTSDEKIDLFSDEIFFKENIGKSIENVKELLYIALQKSKTVSSWKTFAERELGLKNGIDIVDFETGEVSKAHFTYNFRKQKKNGDFEDIKLKGNTTKATLHNILKHKDDTWFNQVHSSKQQITNLQFLWEIIYDITNKDENKVAEIIKFHYSFDDAICSQLANIKFDDVGMASLSAKAIRQILPLMRNGEDITEKGKVKINSIIKLNTSKEESAKDDDSKLESIKNFISDKKTRLRLSKFIDENGFKYLNYWEATAVIYGSHSTTKIEPKGKIIPVKHHSMNNPIVEKIVNETISVVNEIYNRYGFDEVRIELSRELKASMEERTQMWEGMNNNAEKNEWAKQMLRELKSENSNLDVETSNKSNIDKIKIIEDVVKYKISQLPKEKIKEYKLEEPSKTEIKRYLMWLEQNFRCPYTNHLIPFTDVFARGKIVEIEHIIPRERYYLNSYANKVITWREVNQAKADNGNRTAYEFIVSKRSPNDIITLSDGKTKVQLVSQDNWKTHIEGMFPKGGKRTNLLRKEIPEDPINRTLNETQYINKKLKEKLAELIGDEKVWVTSGAVTDILRDRWHLNNVMKELLRNRFENFEIPTGKKKIEINSFSEQKRIFAELVDKINLPFEAFEIQFEKKSFKIYSVALLEIIYSELQKTIEKNEILSANNQKTEKIVLQSDFEIKNLTHFTKHFNSKTSKDEDIEVFEGFSKRLDHRHHALDAIIIACTKQNHVQYINTLNAINNADQESDTDKKIKYNSLKKEICIGDSSKKYYTPWEKDSFIVDVKNVMNELVISHKNTRLLISPSKHRIDKGIKTNKIASIRGELHKETNYARKNYFIIGEQTPIQKLIPQIVKMKMENQFQTMVHLKTFGEIIKETVLKEKYQNILISLFIKYDKESLNKKLNSEISASVLEEIKINKLLCNSKNNEPLEWLSTFSEKDKSNRPNGLSMNFNDLKEIKDIADPRIKRLAEYRFEYVKQKREKLEKLDIDKKEKDEKRNKLMSLPLYSNAIYEVRIKMDSYNEELKTSINAYKWVELKDFDWNDFDKIEYSKKETTVLIKTKLREIDFVNLKQTYFEKPIFISKTPILVKKVRQKAFFQDLYEITKGRYVYSRDVFMTFVFSEKNQEKENTKREIKFLKFLDASKLISFDKPDKIDYSKLINKEKSFDEIQKNIQYDLLFTLAKNDLVYLPDNILSQVQQNEIDWNDKKSILPYLYIVKDMEASNNRIIFQQLYKSDAIKISEADAKSLFKNSELKEQREEIKYGIAEMMQSCIKVFTDKLGKKVVPYWEFPNGCWEKERAEKLGLTSAY